ncbi:MAG: cation:proton antiporter [Planctomycetota bacterium]|jgi:CPA2 family monovalent cation:H+ antiporter-2|nr:cation:proton antiporter [Planctomycetota bacterium]
MHNELLTQVLMVLALGLPVVMVFRRLGVSALVAYLVTGVLVGMMGTVDGHDLEVLAEMGATMLLFSIGLEMDLQELRVRMRKILIGAVGQIGSTIVVGMLLMMALGKDPATSFALGCCLALSSTLMVIRALDESGLRNREEGKTVLGLLLAQDFAIAPMLVAMTMVLPSKGHTLPIWQTGAGLVGVVFATILLRRLVASKLFSRIQDAGLPELEVAFAVTTALGAAWFTESMGLGAAIGAFCAGLALGGDEHRHTIETATRPLQGLLAIVFFVSVGMQFDPSFVLAKWPLVLAGLAVSVVIKSALAALAFRVAGMKTRSAIGAGIMVGQVGEFSFVLAAAALRGSGNAEDNLIYNLVISIACLSLAGTPALVAIAQRLLPRPELARITTKGDTVVVAGLGPVGNTVVQNLHAAGYPLMLVDRNEKLLEPWANTAKIHCHQGRIEDMEDWLPALGERPRVVILTFPIADTSALVADRLLRLAPGLLIIARSQFEAQIPTLINAGVHHVICDEHATANALAPLLDRVLGDPRSQAMIDEAARRKAEATSRGTSRIQKAPDPEPTRPGADE